MNRRDFFLRSKAASLGVAAGLTILPDASSVWGVPANERLSLAIVGLRNRGLVLATCLRPAARLPHRLSVRCRQQPRRLADR